MEFLGIGPLELLFIILIALIILGPKDMIKAGHTIGRTLRNIITSPNWRIIQQASRDMKYLPDRLIREAGLEDLKNDIPNLKTLERDAGLDKIRDEIQDINRDISDWNPPAQISPNVEVDNKVNSSEDSAPKTEPQQTNEPSS